VAPDDPVPDRYGSGKGPQLFELRLARARAVESWTSCTRAWALADESARSAVRLAERDAQRLALRLDRLILRLYRGGGHRA
jgi:hypothetical protein